MNGHITLDRKILEWEWYTNINTKVVFLHLLLKANWKDVRWQGMIIKRGQLVTSIPALSEALALTPKEVRVALDHLITTGEVGRQTTNKYSVITVVKYDEYQPEGRQTADKGQSKGSLRATNEKEKEINNIYSPPESGESVKESAKEKEQILRENFETLYKYYPRKEGKTKAFEYYRQYVGKGRDINGSHRRLTNQQIYHAIQKYVASKEGKDKEYIAHFSTFMNKTILDYVEEPNDTS